MQDLSPAEVSPSKRNLPLFLLASGLVLTAGTAALAARLIWEMTLLTWQRGPQMVGFSLAHGGGVILFFCPFLLVIWFLVFAIFALLWKIKKRAIGRPAWIALACAVLVLALLSIPQGFWNRLFVSRLAASPKSGEFLVTAAGNGEMSMVQSLLRRGVSIQAVNYTGDSALHAAACAGHPEIVRFLLASGANVNLVNLYGDSPLACPTERHNDEIVKTLQAAGGKLMIGDQAQRKHATDVIVRRSIEETEGHVR